MAWLEKLQSWIQNLDEKRFYQYTVGCMAFLALSTFGLMFYYYRATHSYYQKAIQINESRDQVKVLLDKMQHVKQQQRRVDELIAQDENFKIAGYFEDLIASNHLAQKKASKIEVTSPAHEGKYQESILNAKFAAITMQDLTQLLQDIEQTKRVYIKELDIVASKRTPQTIDVALTIATLEPKQETIGEVE